MGANLSKEAALRYYGQGFNVLAMAPGGRNPSHEYTKPPRDYKTRRQTLEEVEKLPWQPEGGVALVCGLGVHCIDFDASDEDKKNPEARGVDVAAVVQLCEALGLGSSYEWVVRSGSHKGFHVWVRCEDDFSQHYQAGAKWWFPREEPARFHHLEHRWNRCYTIAPPTPYKTQDGRRYEFLHGEPQAPPALVTGKALYEALATIATPKGEEPEHATTEVQPVTLEASTAAYEKASRARQATTTEASVRKGLRFVDVSTGEELSLEEKAAREEAVKEEIRARFDVKEYIRRMLGVAPSDVTNAGHEWRIGREGAGLGGWHVKKDGRTWNTFHPHRREPGDVGGDCFDAVAFKLYGEWYDLRDSRQWRAVLEEAAQEAGVALPAFELKRGAAVSGHVSGNTTGTSTGEGSSHEAPLPRKRGRPSNADAVQEWLSRRFKFRWNTVLLRIEYTMHEEEKWDPITDNAEAGWRVSFEKHSGVRPGRDAFSDYVRDLAHENKYDPFVSYFDALQPYDPAEGDHIRVYGSLVKPAHPELFHKHFTKWLVGVYACGYHDAMSDGGSNLNELFLVLVGAQGAGKTRFLRNLLRGVLDKYVLGKKITETKDSEQLLSQALLLIDDELRTVSAVDMEAVKKTLSERSYKFRPPYGKHPEEFPRRVSFCGSTNAREFFRDPTGSRRFLIHEVGEIDLEGLRKYDVSRVWAQVKHLHEAGVLHYLTKEEQAEAEIHNRAYSAPTTEEDLLLKYFAPVEWGSPKASYLTTSQVAMRISFLHDQEHTTTQVLGFSGETKIRDGVPRFRYDSPAVVQRLGALLQASGFKKNTKRVQGTERKMWALREKPKHEWYSDFTTGGGEDVPF